MEYRFNNNENNCWKKVSFVKTQSLLTLCSWTRAASQTEHEELLTLGPMFPGFLGQHELAHAQMLRASMNLLTRRLKQPYGRACLFWLSSELRCKFVELYFLFFSCITFKKRNNTKYIYTSTLGYCICYSACLEVCTQSNSRFQKIQRPCLRLRSTY